MFFLLAKLKTLISESKKQQVAGLNAEKTHVTLGTEKKKLYSINNLQIVSTSDFNMFTATYQMYVTGNHQEETQL